MTIDAPTIMQKNQTMESFVDKKKPHAVCLPLPFQSHIMAMLKFAKLLYLKGFCITFVNTEFNHQKVQQSRGPDSLNGLPDFRFETIPDGLPPCDINGTQQIIPLALSIVNAFADPFASLIASLNEESARSDGFQVTCVVADACLSTQLESVVEGLRIPSVLLWTMSAACLMCSLHCQHLVAEGLIPPKDKNDLPNVYLDTPVNSIPGMTDIRLKDLHSFFWEDDDPMENFLVRQLQGLSHASAIVINTFDALETDVLAAMKPLLAPVYAIGPLHLLLEDISKQELNSIGSNMLKEDEESIKWLDSQQPNSILYVNFGSLMVLSSEQFLEFAWGLANSRCAFLWVIRPNLVVGQNTIFPAEFIEEIADRGMVTEWCPQERVLSHPSTAGFLTHSGWNSTMETLCAGVPVISWPGFVDQPLNCRYSCFHWGIGIEMEKNVKRDQIEGCVRELMEGGKGNDMKKKSIAYRKSAEESTRLGGTSYEDLNRVVEMLLQKMNSS